MHDYGVLTLFLKRLFFLSLSFISDKGDVNREELS